MEQLFFAGKAYLKINSLVKTPSHEFMAVERSGLWAPACVLYARSRYICLDLANGVWIKITYIYIYIYFLEGFCKFPCFLLGNRIHFFSLVRRV